MHGILLASQFSYLVGMRIPGKRALYLGQDLSFRRPVLVGETIEARAKVTAKSSGTRTLVLATEIRNSSDEMVVSGSAKVKVRDQEKVSGQSTTPNCKSDDQKVASVTGGSRGIGAATAMELSRRGFFVVVGYASNTRAAERVVGQIGETGAGAVHRQVDVRDREQVLALIDGVVAEFGHLDVLVNGAIGELRLRPFDELGWSAFQYHLATQVHGAFNTCKAAHHHLAARRGVVVNIPSQVVHGSPPAQMADYVVAKYALLGLSRALASEWASDGIRVNTVSPGLTRTELTQPYNERVFKMDASRTPLRRLASPEDTAKAIAFLLEEASDFLTGVDLPVTGGQVMS